MDPASLIAPLLTALHEHDIAYALVGSFSSNHYGIPRSTQDADLVLQSDTKLDQLVQALGDNFSLDPQLMFESVTGTMRWIIQHADSEFKIELFLLSEDPHDQARFARRVEASFNGVPAWVVTAEDVVVMKLRWGREKDVADVRDVVAVQGEALDWDYIHDWTETHGTRAQLDAIRAELAKLGF